MPTYEYRCQTCDETFEARRPMAEADAPAPCPSGHADAVRLLSVFAVATASSGGSSQPAAGRCGGQCACYPE